MRQLRTGDWSLEWSCVVRVVVASVTNSVPSGCVLMSPTEFEARITAAGVQFMALCEYNSRYASDWNTLGEAIYEGDQEGLLTPERKAALSDLNDRGNWAKHLNLGHDWRTVNGVFAYRDCATACASSATDASPPIYPLFKRCCEDAVLPFLLWVHSGKVSLHRAGVGTPLNLYEQLGARRQRLCRYLI